MTMQIRKAERKQAKLRVGVFGPSGSGKTMSALKMAYGMTQDWSKVVVIDSENSSAELYSNLGPYNVLVIESPYSPEKYIEAIATCEKSGAEVIIIDSITHEWAGPGGILELADTLGKDAKNSFAVWAKLTPRHNKFIDKILLSNAHVICCGRSKQDYALNQIEKNGKTINVPEKIGLKAVTREGFDYEMTVSFDLAITHLALSTKDRTSMFQDKPEEIITFKTGERLIEWNMGGAINYDQIKINISHEISRIGYKATGAEDYKKLSITLTGLELKQENYEEILATLKTLPTVTAPTPPAGAFKAPVSTTTGKVNQSVAPAPQNAASEATQGEEDVQIEDVDFPLDDQPGVAVEKISGPKLTLLRGLVKQKANTEGDDKIREFLSFYIEGIRLPEKLEDLDKVGGDMIIHKLMAMPAINQEK